MGKKAYIEHSWKPWTKPKVGIKLKSDIDVFLAMTKLNSQILLFPSPHLCARVHFIITR